MPRFLSPRSQQNRPLPQARPMNPMQQMPVQPQVTPATSMGMGAPQQARPMGQMGAQQARPMNPMQQMPVQPQVTPATSMGMGAPQQAAPLGAGAGFGAPPQGPQFNPASLQGRPMKKGGAVKKMASGGMTSSASKRADGVAQRGKTKGRMC